MGGYFNLDNWWSIGGPAGWAGKKLIGEGSPEHKMAGLDDASNRLLEGQVKDSQKSPDQIAQETMQGTDTSGMLRSQDKMQRSSTALGMANDQDIQNAIHARANRNYSSDINKLQQKIQSNAAAEKFARMQGVMGPLAKQQQLQDNIYQKRADDYAAISKMRNNIIAQLFAGGGYVAGGISTGKNQQSGPGSGISNANGLNWSSQQAYDANTYWSGDYGGPSYNRGSSGGNYSLTGDGRGGGPSLSNNNWSFE